MAFQVEVIVDTGMNRGKLRQGLHVPEAYHGTFSSTEGQMAVLTSIVQPLADYLAIVIAHELHGCTV